METLIYATTTLLALFAIGVSFVQIKTKKGHALWVVLFLILAIIGGILTYKQSRNTEREKREAKEDAENQQRSQEATKAKLNDQFKISVALSQSSTALSQELAFVRRELDIQRRVARDGSALWEIAMRIPTVCFGDYVTEASTLRNDAGEKLGAQSLNTPVNATEASPDQVIVVDELTQAREPHWHYELDPNQLPIPNYCKEEVIRLFTTIHLHVIFQKDRTSNSILLNPTFIRALYEEDDIKFAFVKTHTNRRGTWSFTEKGDVRDLVFAHLDKKTDRAQLCFRSLLSEDALHAADGTAVSTLEISDAQGVAMIHKAYDSEISRIERMTLSAMEPAVWAPSLELRGLTLTLNDQPFKKQAIVVSGQLQVGGVGGRVPPDMASYWLR